MQRETIEIYLEYPNEMGGPVVVEFVEPTRVIVLSEPWSYLGAERERDLLHLPDFRDVVEVEKIDGDKYAFVKVLERARFERVQYLLPDPETTSVALEPVLTRTMDLGGYWERMFGGVLTIWLPPECDYDPSEDIQACVDSAIDQ